MEANGHTRVQRNVKTYEPKNKAELSVVPRCNANIVTKLYDSSTQVSWRRGKSLPQDIRVKTAGKDLEGKITDWVIRKGVTGKIKNDRENETKFFR
jgi:hypothetical protein